MPDVSAAAARRPMGAVALTVWALIASLALGGFLALGQWQIERRVWKVALIHQIEERAYAPVATAAPAPPQWSSIMQSGQDYAYRRVTLDGVWLHQHSTLVQASTVLGRGWWVMTPLRANDGAIVLINRGFVPQGQTEGAWRTQPQARTTITGLLRLSEPHGTFLRANDPAQGRWFSRDVTAIAASHGLENVAPYFIDVEANAPLPPTWQLEPPLRLPDALLPIGGLTVLSFANNHLTYALS